MGLFTDLGNEWRAYRSGYPQFVRRDLASLEAGDIPVLVHHSIDPREFAAELQWLHDAGYRTIGTDEFLNIQRGVIAGTGKEVLLAIDDARTSVWRYGLPLLKQYSSRAVLFVIAGWTKDSVEGVRPNLDDVPSGRTSMRALHAMDPHDLDICTWPELRAMQNSGLVDLESHSWLHRRVFAGRTLRRVVSAGAPIMPFDCVYSPYLDPQKDPNATAAAAWQGLPLFETVSLFAGRAWWQVPPALLERWREAAAAGHAHPSQQIAEEIAALPWVDAAGQAAAWREDLVRSRDVLRTQLANPQAARTFCLPFTEGCERVTAITRELGIEACFWGVRTDRTQNKPPASLQHVVRVKSDFVRRLPGRGRQSLSAIYFGKFARRLRGEAPY